MSNASPAIYLLHGNDEFAIRSFLDERLKTRMGNSSDSAMDITNLDGREKTLEAVQAAATIRQKAQCINNECLLGSEPVIINMGICSGRAFVGASKFESYTGGRWAYTSHGTTTNVAARLCGQATGGEILVSRDTARRTHGSFAFEHRGPHKLKNLSGEIDVFALA